MLVCKNVKKSVSIDKEYDEVELMDVISQLKTTAGIIRFITEETSIRTGKYGNYIFHKKKDWILLKIFAQATNFFLTKIVEIFFASLLFFAVI